MPFKPFGAIAKDTEMPRSPKLTLPALSALALTLSACAGTPASEGESAVSVPERPSMEPSCGAEMLDAYVGKEATDSVIETLRQWRDDKPIRVLKPGAMMTMDFRPDRLNVNVDANNIITGFRCN